MAEMDMREVVRRLRAENSEALLELLEFDNALDEFILFVERLAVTSQALCLAARNVGAEVEERIGAVQEGADKLRDGMTQALDAFRQLRNATKFWEIVAVGELQPGPSNGGASSTGEP